MESWLTSGNLRSVLKKNTTSNCQSTKLHEGWCYVINPINPLFFKSFFVTPYVGFIYRWLFCIFRYGRWVTRRVAVGTIATIWLLAALISFVPISLGLHRPQGAAQLPQQPRPTCALDLTPSYAVVSSCISFYVPCIVMIGIYCRYDLINTLDPT